MAYAQEQDLLHLVDEEGIHLRWKGERSVGLDGYNVFRQEQGANQWVQINPELLTMVFDRDEIEEIAGYQSAFS